MFSRPDAQNHNGFEESLLGPVWTYPVSYPKDFAVCAVTKLRYRNFHGKTDLPGPHIHSGIELGVIHKGRGTFMIGGKRLVFGAGDICILDGSVPHVAFYATACVCTWISFDFNRLFAPLRFPYRVLRGKMFADAFFGNIFALRSYPKIRAIVTGLIDELEKKQPNYEDLVRSYLLLLMASLERLYIAKDSHFTATGSPISADEEALGRIGPAIDFIHKQYADCIGNDELAQMSLMSTTTFRRLFSRLLGMPPHAYLTMYRLRIACGALAGSDKKIDVIAQECGFDDVSSFRRAFGKGMGTTPGAWRRKKSENSR